METRGDDMTFAPYLAFEVRVCDGMLKVIHQWYIPSASQDCLMQHYYIG